MNAALLILFLTFSGAADPMPAATQTVVTQGDCAGCHEDAVAAFVAGPHGRAMAQRSAALLDRSCTTCHGPADEHVADPSAANIRRVPHQDACLSCHQKAAAELRLGSPEHRRHGVECLDCHASGHRETGQPFLMRARPAEFCGSCHRTEAAEFQQPFTHRTGNETLGCTECHSPHARRQSRPLAGSRRDDACIECHASTAGPYVFEHPAGSAGGCTSCHAPHGSTNPRMLQRRTVMELCLECHTNVPTFHNLAQPRFRACATCHIAVHGSNRNPSLFDH